MLVRQHGKWRLNISSAKTPALPGMRHQKLLNDTNPLKVVYRPIWQKIAFTP
jgi:hypothetical protein